MASNRKKLLLPKTLAQAGWDLLQTRDDIEAVPYPIDITNADLRPLRSPPSVVSLLQVYPVEGQSTCVVLHIRTTHFLRGVHGVCEVSGTGGGRRAPLCGLQG